MALILRADDHNFSVSLDDLALVAHGLDGRTYFHDDVLLICVFKVIWRRRRSGSRVGRNDARKRGNELRRKRGENRIREIVSRRPKGFCVEFRASRGARGFADGSLPT